MKLKVNLNVDKINQKVTNDNFGILIAHQWKKLIDPYTPRDTGQLMGITGQTVDVMPFKLHYKMPYASAVYYGKDMTFKKKNPYATYEWDKAAEKAGQKDKLYRTLNNALRSGQF